MSKLYIVIKLNTEEAAKNSDVVYSVHTDLEKAVALFNEWLQLMEEDHEQYEGSSLVQEGNHRYVFEDDNTGYYSVLELREIEDGKINGLVF